MPTLEETLRIKAFLWCVATRPATTWISRLSEHLGPKSGRDLARIDDYYAAQDE